MKKQHFSILFILLSLVVGYGQTKQDLPEIIKPSPTVASLMRFEEVPVNYYTGQPNIAIPLFSKQLDKNLSLNLALQYSTQGIKVAELSGWVGTGWALEVGGVISRTVRDIPDEFQKGPNGISTGVLHNPDFWNYNNLSSADKKEFDWKAKGSSIDRYDTELDLYQFSLLGTSGRFIIIKENGILIAKLLSKNQNVKIIPTYNTSTYHISSFKIIDPYGYQYTFDVKENTISEPVNSVLNQGNNSVNNIFGSGATNVFNNTSAWHISTVKSTNDKVLATFTYSIIGEAYTASVTRTENTITSTVTPDFLNNAYNLSILEPKRVVSHYTTSVQTQKPLKITFRDGTSIDFITGTNHPETGGAILTDIIIKNNNQQENKRYKLIYSTTERLWLDKIEEKAGQQTLPYTLFYIDKQGLPAFNSPNSDDWGYNSGISTINGICATGLQFDANAIKKGLLWKINYPTGGSKEFIFEHNTFSHVGSQLVPASEYVSNPINASASSITNNYQGDNNSVSIASIVSISHAQDIYISTSLQVGSQTDANRFRMRLWNNNGYEALFNINNPSCVKVNVQPGVYFFGLKLVDGLTLDPFYVQGTARLDYTVQNSTVSEFLTGGGVRIKEILFKDGFSIQKKVSYDYSDPQNPNKSSGTVDSQLGNMTNEYTVSYRKYLFSGNENIAGAFFPRYITYHVKTKGANAKLTQGGYVGYKSVKVSEQNNGYSRFTYTTAQDYPSPLNSLVFPYWPAPNIDYKRGQLLQQVVYNKANQKLKEITNTYTFIEDIIAHSFKVFTESQCVWNQFYDAYSTFLGSSPLAENVPFCGQISCFTNFYNCGNDSGLYTVNTNLISGWPQLTQTISKEYFYDDSNTQSTVEKITDYAYNSSNFQQNNVTTYFYENNLLAEHYTTELFYPVGGYPINTYSASEQQAISKMASLNKINIPIYTKNYKNNVLLNTTQSIYYEFLPNLVELKKVKTAKGSNTLDPRLDYLSYDSHGNIREVSKDKGTIITYLWGYNHSYPVAKIENATYSQIEALPYFGSNFTITNGLSTNQENSLRNLPNALVTTFTYDPLVGLISSKDPRGYKTTFHYDELNRLKWVKDQDGKILSENQYHYKN